MTPEMLFAIGGFFVGVSTCVSIFILYRFIQGRKLELRMNVADSRRKQREAAGKKLLSFIDTLVDQARTVYEETESAKHRAQKVLLLKDGTDG